MEPAIDIFDKLYPILSTQEGAGATHRVYINTYLEGPETFSEILGLLATAPDTDTIIFIINNGGGFLSSLLQIRDAISRCACPVVAEIAGTVASAATMLALSCDDIYVADHTTFMIHNFSGGSIGKGGEIRTEVPHLLATTDAVFKEVYHKFLTKKEIKRVLQDRDIYLTSQEVRERFAKVIQYRMEHNLKLANEAAAEQEASLVQGLEEIGYTITKPA